MKKLLILLIAVSLLFSFASCAGSETDTPGETETGAADESTILSDTPEEADEDSIDIENGERQSSRWKLSRSGKQRCYYKGCPYQFHVCHGQ